MHLQHRYLVVSQGQSFGETRQHEVHSTTNPSRRSSSSYDCRTPVMNSIMANCFSVTLSACTNPAGGRCCRRRLMAAPACASFHHQLRVHRLLQHEEPSLIRYLRNSRYSFRCVACQPADRRTRTPSCTESSPERPSLLEALDLRHRQVLVERREAVLHEKGNHRM